MDYCTKKNHFTSHTTIPDLLYVELVLPDWNAVDKLQRGPQSVELGALVDVDDPIGGRAALPHGIVQEGLDAVQDYLGQIIKGHMMQVPS